VKKYHALIERNEISAPVSRQGDYDMRGLGSEQRASSSGRAAALAEIDTHPGSRPWPRIIAPIRNSVREGREAALADRVLARAADAEAALAQARGRERAAVARIAQLHGELKAREVELGEARQAAAAAGRDAETLRTRLAAAEAALAAASREAAEKEATARLGIRALRRELAHRGAALLHATQRLREMASRLVGVEIDAIEAEAANAALAAVRSAAFARRQSATGPPGC
jgi:chromosome segregation protein